MTGQTTMRRMVAVLMGVGTLALAGCGGSTDRAAPPPVVAAPKPPPPAPSWGPVLAQDGSCTGSVPATATEIAPGIPECELVRLKGHPPTDVLVGESGRGQREVQVLYTEPGAKELYFFVNNRLDRIVK
ncbi:hypothetical protein [Methylobacterium ajmalii]|jgi:hypothetical protein|uniref:Lipoprotein n=2 Tax=Methylobacterium TaxID=407 RepID=A0A0C6EXT2_9HYPH|nr:hypothetical protein Maq22A_c08390 [Methylobacterium aquaticum]SFF20154.1 hypothetical protein SAMN04487844_111174 [Methylobacterium sp. yr596]